MAILMRPTQNLSILPRQKWPEFKMAAILPNFEVRDLKLVYNPKLYMLLVVYGKNQNHLQHSNTLPIFQYSLFYIFYLKGKFFTCQPPPPSYK